MIENIKTINLFIYLVDNFEKIDVALFKLIYFDNVDKLRYKITFMQAKEYFIFLFEIYKLIFAIIMKFLIHLSETDNVENFDFNFNIILL